jgi:hypothetical protein
LLDRHITLIHLRNRFVTAVDTARRTPGIRNNRISDQTVRNRLRQSGLRSRRPLKGIETGLHPIPLHHRLQIGRFFLHNHQRNVPYDDDKYAPFRR